MKTTEELILAVHARAATLRRKRIASAGAASGALMVALAALIGRLGGLTHRPAAEGYAGASMLSEDAGGYVLAAVLAFMLGVVVTVACVQGRKRKTDRILQDRESTEATEEGGLHRDQETLRGRKS